MSKKAAFCDTDNERGRYKTWFLSHHYQVLIASQSLFEQMNMAISVPSEIDSALFEPCLGLV